MHKVIHEKIKRNHISCNKVHKVHLYVEGMSSQNCDLQKNVRATDQEQMISELLTAKSCEQDCKNTEKESLAFYCSKVTELENRHGKFSSVLVTSGSNCSN